MTLTSLGCVKWWLSLFPLHIDGHPWCMILNLHCNQCSSALLQAMQVSVSVLHCFNFDLSAKEEWRLRCALEFMASSCRAYRCQKYTINPRCLQIRWVSSFYLSQCMNCLFLVFIFFSLCARCCQCPRCCQCQRCRYWHNLLRFFGVWLKSTVQCEIWVRVLGVFCKGK